MAKDRFKANIDKKRANDSIRGGERDERATERAFTRAPPPPPFSLEKTKARLDAQDARDRELSALRVKPSLDLGD